MFLKVTSPPISVVSSLGFFISVSVFKNSFTLFIEASALCTKEVTHPTDATGHVSMFTYIINSAMFPVVIVP